MKWVKCLERLPEPNKEILLCWGDLTLSFRRATLEMKQDLNGVERPFLRVEGDVKMGWCRRDDEYWIYTEDIPRPGSETAMRCICSALVNLCCGKDEK